MRAFGGCNGSGITYSGVWLPNKSPSSVMMISMHPFILNLENFKRFQIIAQKREIQSIVGVIYLHDILYSFSIITKWEYAEQQNIPERIYKLHKFQNAPVEYTTMLQSENKCAHLCSEWSIVGWWTGTFWDMWIRSIVICVCMLPLTHELHVQGRCMPSLCGQWDMDSISGIWKRISKCTIKNTYIFPICFMVIMQLGMGQRV